MKISEMMEALEAAFVESKAGSDASSSDRRDWGREFYRIFKSDQTSVEDVLVAAEEVNCWSLEEMQKLAEKSGLKFRIVKRAKMVGIEEDAPFGHNYISKYDRGVDL
jgi:hypothetical protein